MINNRDIICISNDWHNDPTSKHQIMKILSRCNTVLWVNSIGLRKPVLGRNDIKRMFMKIISFFRGLEKINDNMFVFTPVVVPFHDFIFIKYINSLILEYSLRYYIRRLGMKNIIYWSYMPNVGYVLKRMKAQLIIYHCVDEWSKFTFIDKNIIEAEREICEMSDLVLTSAKILFENKKLYNKNTYYISHGVDYDYFHHEEYNYGEMPSELKIISKPIVGFFGLIHEWIDLELLDYVARNNETTSFVFIGKTEVDVSRLKENKNVYFIGQKPYDELVSYAKYFDVGMIPFKINDLTVNVNPIKLKEYFAMGIPVISVDLPEIRPYERVVRIAKDYCSFDEALKAELSGNQKASREDICNIARNETWEKKVDQISSLIENTCGI